MRRFYAVIGMVGFSVCAILGTPVGAVDWTIESVDAGGGLGNWSGLALDGTGRPHISYAYLNAPIGHLKYAAWNGNSWDIATVDTGGNTGYYTSLALDSQGNPHISYQERIGQGVSYLKYAQWTGSSWDIQTVDSGGDGGWGNSLALDSTGKPQISYCDNTSNVLKYATWTGSSWDVQTVDSGGSVNDHTSLALDKNGNPHIAYGYIYSAMRYASWTGSEWETQTFDSDGRDVGWRNSLVLDQNGNPHISYGGRVTTEGDSNIGLKYASWDGSNWQVEFVGSDFRAGVDSCLTLDSDGNPYISYTDQATDILRLAVLKGGKWTFETIDSSEPATGQHSSLALDNAGTLHISYESGGLMYAHGAVPEPGTLLLLGTGLVGLSALRRRT